MMSPCDAVAERLVMGTPLAELAQHAEDCPRCQGLLAVERKLGTSGRQPAPAQGFTSRMTVIATQRLVARQRRRVVGYATLSAMAAAIITIAVMRQPASDGDGFAQRDERSPVAQPAASDPRQAELEPTAPELPLEQDEDAPPVEDPAALEEDVHLLLELSRAPAAPVSADWSLIEAPLAPYDRLLQQMED